MFFSWKIKKNKYIIDKYFYILLILMKKLITFVLFMVLYFWFTYWLSISPLKFEYEIKWWDSDIWTIKITNTEDKAVTLYVSKEDFVADNDTGNPKFIKPSEWQGTEFGLSNWITVWEDHITLASWETREVLFKVEVPTDSEPWGHYWAIFFSAWWVSWQVSVVSRLWVLILVDVPWDEKIQWDMTKFNVWRNSEKWFNDMVDFIQFPVDFEIWFKNSWNVHIKPKWEILIYDEDGNQLKNIWKENVTNKFWAFIWSKPVDYIPINDARWNVLRNSERTFRPVWEWFGNKILNEDWTTEVKFKWLQEYYDEQWKDKVKYIQFRQIQKTEKVKKKFTLQMTLSYELKDWEEVKFKELKDIYLEYTETKLVLNNWIVWWWIFILLVVLYYLIVWKKRAEDRLKRKLIEDMKKW